MKVLFLTLFAYAMAYTLPVNRCSRQLYNYSFGNLEMINALKSKFQVVKGDDCRSLEDADSELSFSNVTGDFYSFENGLTHKLKLVNGEITKELIHDEISKFKVWARDGELYMAENRKLYRIYPTAFTFSKHLDKIIFNEIYSPMTKKQDCYPLLGQQCLFWNKKPIFFYENDLLVQGSDGRYTVMDTSEYKVLSNPELLFRVADCGIHMCISRNKQKFVLKYDEKRT